MSEKNKRVRVQATLSNKTVEILNELMAEKGMTRSTLIDIAVQEFFNNLRRENDKTKTS